MKNKMLLKRLNFAIPLTGFLANAIFLIYCGVHFNPKYNPASDWIKLDIIVLITSGVLTIIGYIRLYKHNKSIQNGN